MRKRAYRVLLIFSIFIITLLAVCPLSYASVVVHSSTLLYGGSGGQAVINGGNIDRVSVNFTTNSSSAFTINPDNGLVVIFPNNGNVSPVSWFFVGSKELNITNPDWFYFGFSIGSQMNCNDFTVYIVENTFDDTNLPLAGPDPSDYAKAFTYAKQTNGTWKETEILTGRLSSTESGWIALVMCGSNGNAFRPVFSLNDVRIVSGVGDYQTWLFNNQKVDTGLDDEINNAEDAMENIDTDYADILLGVYNPDSFTPYLKFGGWIDFLVDNSGLSDVYVFSLVMGFLALLLGVIAVVARRFKQ